MKNTTFCHRMTFVPLVSVFMCFYFNKPIFKFIENNIINSHTQNTTALQSSVSLNGIHGLLVTNWEPFSFPQSRNLQMSTAKTSVPVRGLNVNHRSSSCENCLLCQLTRRGRRNCKQRTTTFAEQDGLHDFSI